MSRRVIFPRVEAKIKRLESSQERGSDTAHGQLLFLSHEPDESDGDWPSADTGWRNTDCRQQAKPCGLNWIEKMKMRFPERLRLDNAPVIESWSRSTAYDFVAEVCAGCRASWMAVQPFQ
jgi:hypothetical protein